MEDKIEKVREILDKSQWQFTDARHGVIGTKYPDNRSFAKDIVRLFEPQSIEGKNKIEQVKEKLGQLDLYLTYDGHLSGMDINNILTQFNFCSQPIKITKAKFKTAYADEVDDQCSCYGLTCSCCGEEYFTEEAFPEPQLCPRCSKPIKYCDSHQPRCNARILRQEGHSLCCRYGWCEFALPSQDIDLCSQPLEGIENLREEIAELLYFDFTYYERGTLVEMAWREIPQARKDVWLNKADQILAKLTQFIEKREQLIRAEYKDAVLDLEAQIGGIDEFLDWSEEGLRSFRKKTMSKINAYCKELKEGAHLEYLHEHIEQERQKAREEGYQQAKEKYDIANKSHVDVDRFYKE